ncbi:hypothetical protein BDM02DRAFT_2708221 [Thelephora ganbajun]|uniref:Uncharacterized protein n=1 Tax=Thelephora ganbajun TaxID=370292 RepID=A0ACB6ZCJ1_THEGA|nr:hypothetical protein BDM02DRAFT_2708221 [Thelephora ganbajun]
MCDRDRSSVRVRVRLECRQVREGRIIGIEIRKRTSKGYMKGKSDEIQNETKAREQKLEVTVVASVRLLSRTTYIKAFVGRHVNKSRTVAWELANQPRCGQQWNVKRRLNHHRCMVGRIICLPQVHRQQLFGSNRRRGQGGLRLLRTLENFFYRVAGCSNLNVPSYPC